MADLVQIMHKGLSDSNPPEPKKAAQGKMADGTEQSGFVTGAQNKPPRECSNCIWMAFGSCGHPEIVSDPELKDRLNERGRVKVDEDDCSNKFQSQGNVLLYIVRHGVTTPDELGLHGGFIDDPLNETGKAQAEDAGAYMKGKSYKHVISSDMDRAQETARIVAPVHKRYVDKQLRPWDIGVFAGKEHSEHKDEFEHFIKHPHIQIPDGESLMQFGVRMHAALMKYVEFARKNGTTLLVMHSRNFTQFKRAIEDKSEFKKPRDWDKVAEGGIMVVLDEDGFLKAEIVYNRGDGKDAANGS